MPKLLRARVRWVKPQYSGSGSVVADAAEDNRMGSVIGLCRTFCSALERIGEASGWK